jgi:uncharacterized repeat protein (TIGR03803 family)
MTPDGVVSWATSAIVSGSLMQGRDGNFYGVDRAGVYKLTLAGVYSLLHYFPYVNDTFFPNRLVQAGDGNLYGATTDAADNSSLGEIFKVSPSGDWTVLHKFTGGDDGDTPWAGLTIGPDGNLYGTTSGGGALGQGVIFRVTLDGVFSVVHGFTGGTDGARPSSSELLSATDGNLYGTTSSGAFGFGTFFRMSLDGTVTTLNAVKAGPDGAYPQAPPLQASDDNFYGTTPRGGSYDRGVLYRMSGSGTVTILHEFTGGLDGSFPTGALIEGPGGYLYGTAPQNGQFNAGVVFRVAPTTGVFETLHAFGKHRAHPYAALLLARDGRLYGTTSDGGAFGHGTVFTMTADGDVTVLHSFAGDADGAEPVAPLSPGGGRTPVRSGLHGRSILQPVRRPLPTALRHHLQHLDCRIVSHAARVRWIGRRPSDAGPPPSERRHLLRHDPRSVRSRGHNFQYDVGWSGEDPPAVCVGFAHPGN